MTFIAVQIMWFFCGIKGISSRRPAFLKKINLNINELFSSR
ncbi:hypothetical protein ECRM12761_24035 [Escherichia coli O145:H28 str. RM12761]|uniref:Uncharacterized protein n=1 Tax=Escherichia coli O145:H28 (strain RM12581) TaxID=1248823 RepID=A0ABC8A0B0_ECOLR|nr:hypothetical protein ECRM13514_5267 [Escherichia coli O145:H28 str. RM13514]AHG17521.1 hypothetical protein ECRM13516_4935 [Escherichia coli O145:H28 str. RM13516]AHY67844.1 hypothetical protein ECRM12761_24035 [Escherichia coli O145:H28 str. RM12761]AHY73706.1 hypothetical protein ECRM12581_25880 [Escherichia coli O145:H28 str. RM12581]